MLVYQGGQVLEQQPGGPGLGTIYQGGQVLSPLFD